MKYRKIINRPNGFSLLELVFAIGILGLAILMVVGLFVNLFRSSQKGVDLTAGTTVAEAELNRFLYKQQETAGGLEALPSGGSVADQGNVVSSNQRYYYKISSSDAGSTELKKVDIVLWWWDGDRGQDDLSYRRTGYGKLQVRMSRLVYTKNKVTLINANP